MFRCTCPGSGPGSASKIYVGNLPSDVTKEVPWKSDLFEVPSETSVCQRYSNVSSALMGKELKDPLTFSDLFQTSHLHLSAQIRNSWCEFLQLRPVEDIHIMTGRWQMHCRFIYSIDSLSILAFCHFVFQLRKVEKWPSISIRQVLWSRRGTKLRDFG